MKILEYLNKCLQFSSLYWVQRTTTRTQKYIHTAQRITMAECVPSKMMDNIVIFIFCAAPSASSIAHFTYTCDPDFEPYANHLYTMPYTIFNLPFHFAFAPTCRYQAQYYNRLFLHLAAAAFFSFWKFNHKLLECVNIRIPFIEW